MSRRNTPLSAFWPGPASARSAKKAPEPAVEDMEKARPRQVPRKVLQKLSGDLGKA